MNIPDNAIEAAAKARASGYDSYPAPAKRSILEEVRPILEAAAPFIAAQAWDEGYEAGKHDGYLDSIDYPTEYTNPYRGAGA